MTPEQFCFWLHGYFELNGEDKLEPEQVMMVREHLDLVFNKVTPALEKKLLNEVSAGARLDPFSHPPRLC